MDRELPQDLSYEEAMEKIQSILKKLDEGGIPIDQLEAHIDRANALIAFCQGRLHSIREKLDDKHDQQE